MEISLVYHLSPPLNGASNFNPNPIVPDPPPYTYNLWNSPTYDLNNILGIGNTFYIDSLTGIVSGYVSTIGQFAYAIVAKEYRNGLFLGETRKEYIINTSPFLTVGINTPIAKSSIMMMQDNNAIYFKFVNVQNDKIISIDVYNSLGALITTILKNKNEDIISCSKTGIATGVYFYKAIMGDSGIESGKFIIE